MNLDQPSLRVATADDAPRILTLMKESAAALFPRFYDARQTASAVRHVAQVDPMLLEDGTYFVLESGGELIACGGWSRRDKLYTGAGDSSGDGRALDPAREPARVRAMFVRATGPGAGWVAAFSRSARARLGAPASANSSSGRPCRGFRSTSHTASTPLEEFEVTMPDGVTMACVSM